MKFNVGYCYFLPRFLCHYVNHLWKIWHLNFSIFLYRREKKKNYRLEDLEIFLDFFVLILGINGGNCLIFIDLFYEHSVGLGHAHGNS